MPAAVKRAVLIEAGHRCAIPTCRQAPVEIAHIEPWSTVKAHAVENLIALCPTCHTRYDNGDIDRISMRQYKANLAILNNRYTETERQLLRAFVRKLDMAKRFVPSVTAAGLADITQIGKVRIYSEMDWMLVNLVDDGLITFRDHEHRALQEQDRSLNAKAVDLTPKGAEFLEHWMSAEPLG
ncbi:HNH endonuclease signature motif containing protein [Mycobacterium sp. NPDC050441]|uniref:HNH endonuclease signature motif containing protein n=1 Tax=Mycobacterium sp. NPDC050441 TaxID=3155403 RepID=UPI0034067BB0